MTRKGIGPIAILGATALVAVAVAPTPARAIPAFSRKYATSCATCHVAYPKLNAFGRAFRNNGYRMPGGDEDYLKDENIKLGAEPWKRLWPDAIWPSDLPYLPPIALLVENEIEYRPDGPVKTDFRTPSDIALLTGGTFGDSMSFFGRVNVVAPGADVHVHRFFGQFDDMFGSSLLNLRIGQFETRAVPFSSNRRLAKQDYLINTATMPLSTWVNYLQGLSDDEHGGIDHAVAASFAARAGEHDAADDMAGMDMDDDDPRLALIGVGGHQHGGGGFSLGTTQQGIELWGALSGMGGKGGFEYALGVVNGNGAGNFAATGTNDNNNAKDWYWRASYKFGGMSVLGDPESAPAATNNWQDDSIRVGVFGYHGRAPFTFSPPDADGHDDTHGMYRSLAAALVDGHGDSPPLIDTHSLDERFHRLGGDVDIWFGDLNLFGAYMWGKTEMDPALLEDADVTFRAALAQADYMVYPWLVASLRYERVDYDDAFGDVTRWLPHLTALIRANVKFSAEAALYPDEVFSDRYRFWFNFAF